MLLDIIDTEIKVTNYGDAAAQSIAEGAMALLLATLKDIHKQTQHVRNGGWKLDEHTHGGSLEGLAVGVYGLGAIGRCFVELIRPFKPILYGYDPYMENMPEGIERVNSRETLFARSQAIVIHAGLTEQTQHAITADLLAQLPDHGIIINTARGGIVDQDALFNELASGRLRAGLDVIDPTSLSKNHPARQWTNSIFTAHTVSRGWPDDHQPAKPLNKMQRICLDNLDRFFNNQPLRFLVDRERYLRST